MATLDELNVILGANTTGLEQGLAKGAASVNTFAGAAVRAGATTQASLQGMGQAAAAAAASMGGVSIAAQRAANGGLSDYDKAAGRFLDASGRMHEANGRFVKSAALAAEAAGNLGGSVGGAAQKMGFLATANASLASSFKQADDTREVYEKGFGRLGETFKGIGQSLTTYITLPLVGAATLAGKAAIDFESAFAGVKKTLDTSGLSASETEAEYARLSEGIRQLAQTIPATTTEIAGVAEAAGQLGIKRENVLAFTKVMIDLGNSTNLSADQAATSLARLANITGLPQTQFQNLGSTIVALGNNFATTEAEITEMGLRIAGAGKQVGLTEAQTLGFATALSSVGIAAEAGGTAFSTTLKKIQGAVESGGKELATFAKVAGVSSAEFKKSFQTDAAGATVSFIEGLGRIKDQGGSTLKTLEALKLEDIRVSDSLLRLSGAGDLARRAVSLGTDAFRENTALTKEAGQRYETTASQIQIAKNRLGDIAITIGDALLPLVKSVTSAIGRLADGFKGVSPGVLQTGLAIAGLAAAVGPVLFAVGSLTAALPTLAAGFTVLTGPVGLVLAAVAGAAYLIIDNWDDLVAYFSTGSGGKVFGDLVDSAQKAADAIIGAFQAITGDGTFGDLVSATGLVKSVFEEVTTEVTAFLDTISGGVNTVVKLFAGDFAGALEELGNTAEALTRPLRRLLGLTREVAEPAKNAGYSDYFAALTNNALNALQPVQQVTEQVQDLKKTVEAPSQGTPLTDAQIKALEKLRAALKLNGDLSLELGDTYDFVGQRQSILESGVKDLVAVFGVGSPVVRKFREELQLLSSIQDGAKSKPIAIKIPTSVTPLDKAKDPLAGLPEAIDDSVIKANRAISQLDLSLPVGGLEKGVEVIADLSSRVVNPLTGMSNAAAVALGDFNTRAGEAIDGLNSIISTGLAEAAGNMAAGIANVLTGAAPISSLGGILLGAVGEVLVNLGKMAIATAITVEAIKKAFASPGTALAAGVAAIALGSAIKGVANNILSGGSTSAGNTSLAGGGSGTGAGVAPSTTQMQAQKLNISVDFKPVDLRADGKALRSVMVVDAYNVRRFNGSGR